MKRTIVSLLAVFTIAVGLHAQSKKEQSGKWVKLFDGKTTKGWHSYGRTDVGKSWKVDNGCLHLVPSKDKKGYQTHDGGDLVTDQEFTNFELKLEWKISKGGNSGIIFYVKEDTSLYKETWFTGIETQVLDIKNNEDSNSPKHDIGDLYDLVASKTNAGKPYGEWNRVRIKSVNGVLEIYLNDTQIISTTLWDENWKQLIASSKFKDMPNFGMFKTGKIALQDHGDEVWYRNIMIRQL